MIAPLNTTDLASDGELPRRWLELAEALGRCERSLRDELGRRATPLSISTSQLSLLWACHSAPPEGLGQNELADLLALSPAHVSAQVEQLRAKGLLIGQRKAPDRRRQVWQLTSEGDQRLEALLATLQSWAEQLEEGMSPDARTAITALLGDLAAALEGPQGNKCHPMCDHRTAEQPSQAGAAS